jgi:hypothetical protein
MSKECYWQSHGPTIKELWKRGAWLSEVLHASDHYLPVDRATVILTAPKWTFYGGDTIPPVRAEFPLMSEAEMADGHWVHAEPHSGDCPEAISH